MAIDSILICRHDPSLNQNLDIGKHHFLPTLFSCLSYKKGKFKRDATRRDYLPAKSHY